MRRRARKDVGSSPPTPLPPELRRSRSRAQAVVTTPAGPARAWARASAQGWEVIYLPFQRTIEALERTGNWSLGVLLLLALAAPPLLLLALPRATFRDLARRTVRSYSKRLMIVYTVLLLDPARPPLLRAGALDGGAAAARPADGRRGGPQLGAAAPRRAAAQPAPGLRRRHRLRRPAPDLHSPASSATR